MKLIVNADDYGYDPGINQGIIHAFQKGIVTSSTLMVNQPYSQEAAILALHYPKLGTGLHVNLTRGKPVSPAEQIPGLLSEAGNFREPDEFYRQTVNKWEVHKEISAQLDKMRDLNVSPTHMDAHHHLQHHPVVLEVMLELAKKYHIPLRHVDQKTLHCFRTENILTPDIFVDSFFGEGAALEKLSSMLINIHAKYPGSTVEIMCHPGFVNDFSTESSYRSPRQNELKILCSGEIKELIGELNIELINYRNL